MNLVNIRTEDEKCADVCPLPPGHYPGKKYAFGDVFQCQHGTVWYRDKSFRYIDGAWFSQDLLNDGLRYLRALKALRAAEDPVNDPDDGIQ